MPRAARVQRLQRRQIGLGGGPQAAAWAGRDQGGGLGDALVLAQFAGANEAQAFVQAAAFAGGVQQHGAVVQVFAAAPSSAGARCAGPGRRARPPPARSSRGAGPSASAAPWRRPGRRARPPGLRRGERPATSRPAGAASAARRSVPRRPAGRPRVIAPQFDAVARALSWPSHRSSPLSRCDFRPWTCAPPVDMAPGSVSFISQGRAMPGPAVPAQCQQLPRSRQCRPLQSRCSCDGRRTVTSAPAASCVDEVPAQVCKRHACAGPANGSFVAPLRRISRSMRGPPC